MSALIVFPTEKGDENAENPFDTNNFTVTSRLYERGATTSGYSYSGAGARQAGQRAARNAAANPANSGRSGRQRAAAHNRRLANRR